MPLALRERNDYKSAMRGFYVHIPFCETRCHYCNFVTTAEHAPDLGERFQKALSHEIDQARARHGRLSFDTLYLGGGTPSCLSIPELERLVSGIQGAFELKPGYEFTCEMNPGDGDAGKIETLRALGVNRVSLGCQAFQDEILKKLGRRHTAREIEQTALNLRKAGITNLSFDLMLRVPGQTLEDFRDSLRRCVALEAAQVSLYDLEVHEETLFGRLAKENKLDLSGEEEHARMYESAIEILTGADYEHYEVVNFAKPGLASRHNLTYWHNQEYLGFGPSAFTYLNGIRSQFAPDLERYLEKCENGDWKSDIEDVLTKEEKETETFVTGLRLREGVIPQKFPLIYPRIGKRLAALRYEGLLEEAGEHTRFTLRGQLLSDDVFAFLLEKDTSSKTPLL